MLLYTQGGESHTQSLQVKNDNIATVKQNQTNFFLRTIFGAPRDSAPAEPKENMLQAVHGLKGLKSGLKLPSRFCLTLLEVEKGVETFSRRLEKRLEAPFEN